MREQLLRDGFHVVDELVGPGVVAELRTAYDDIVDRRVAARGDRHLGGLIRQVMVPSADHPMFTDNAALRAARALVCSLMARDDLDRVFDMLIDKPGGTQHETPWHQDAAYFGMPVAPLTTRTDVPVVQVWIALDDVDVDNGCMQFVRAPAGTPLRPHVVASGDPADEGRLLAFAEPFDASGAVAGRLRAGGATLHLAGTPHYTGPNFTERRRRAYIVNIGPVTGPSVRPADTLQVGAGGATGRRVG